jgi:hypothetical protein
MMGSVTEETGVALLRSDTDFHRVLKTAVPDTAWAEPFAGR